MPVFYPSLIVNLKIQFDEAFSTILPPDPVSIQDKAGASSVTPAGPLQQKPLIISGSSQARAAGVSNLSYVSARIPKNGTLDMAGFRQAWKFDFTFDFKDLPIDPRLVRACGVEVYVGAVDPLNFATGMVQVQPDGSRRSIVAQTQKTHRLTGLVDTWTMEHTSHGSEVHISGRDLRGILLDSPIDMRLFSHLNVNQPIDQLVVDILSRHPMGKSFIVSVQPSEWDAPTPQTGVLPSPADKDGLTRVRRGADGDSARSTPQGDASNLNFWDLITRYCFLVGAVPHFINHQLRIRRARSLYDLQKAGFNPATPTPFLNGQPRQVKGQAAPLTVRKLVYGRDIDQLTFERKLGGVKPQVIECVSLDTSSKTRGPGKLLTARWPDKNGVRAAALIRGQTTSVAPSGQLSQQDILRIPLAGINSKQRLQQIAKDIFEEIGRGEMGGACQTKNLSSFGGTNQDPDLLHLEPGDAMEFNVDVRELSSNAPLVAEYTTFTRESFEAAVEELTAKLGDSNLARAIVATTRGGAAELQRFFRVANVKLGFDKNAGIDIHFDFQNFIEARYSPVSPPSTGPNKTPVKHTAVGG